MVSVELLPDGWDVLSETRGTIPEVQTLGVFEPVPFTGHGEDHKAPPYGTLHQGEQSDRSDVEGDLEA